VSSSPIKKLEASRRYRAAHPERVRESARRQRAANPEKRRESSRRYRAKPGYLAKRRIAARRWYKANPAKMREANWRKYGIPVEEARQRLAAHNGTCECCGSAKFSGKGWHLDHDHTTGKIRGIICLGCNAGIGHLGDNLAGVLLAVHYLQRQS